ncbi:hypothetical protein ACOMHN_055988 [Nucella lapillus]
MPSATVEFRVVCCQFLPVYMNFMMKRAVKKSALRIAIVTPHRRVDAVMFGFLLSYLFWGSLLLQCGHVESNPGPNPSKRKDSLRQTQLFSRESSRSRSASREKVDDPQPTASAPPVTELFLQDFMATLNVVREEMKTEFEDLKQNVRQLRKDASTLQK